MPLIVLIAGAGLSDVCRYFIKQESTLLFISLVLIGILITDFYPKSFYSFKKTQFGLGVDQETDIRIGEYMRKEYPDYKKSVLYFQGPFLSEVLDINLFDTEHCHNMHEYKENKPRPAEYFIIWDDWYARVDAGVTHEMIAADSSLTTIKTFEYMDPWDNIRKSILYKNK